MSHVASQATEAEQVVWSPRLGAHLEASRKHANLRRVDLATQMGVSEETIRLWEKGTVQPSTGSLSRVIALLALETAEWPTGDDPTADLPPLARRLWNERKGRGITQAAAARSLAVPPATYAGWETGRTTPGQRLLPRLASFLGVADADVATLCATPFVVDTAGWPPFGQFVGARRQELRLTRPALADRLGISANTLVAWELGSRVPGTQQIPRLAAALAVDTASLVAALPSRGAATALGKLIQDRQRELGLRAADVARLVGTTEATISRWVHGHSRPAPKNVRRLADVLKLQHASVLDALGGTA